MGDTRPPARCHPAPHYPLFRPRPASFSTLKGRPSGPLRTLIQLVEAHPPLPLPRPNQKPLQTEPGSPGQVQQWDFRGSDRRVCRELPSGSRCETRVRRPARLPLCKQGVIALPAEASVGAVRNKVCKSASESVQGFG